MVNNQIVNQICAHADREGGGYNKWYCGIAAEPTRRLFNDHNVPKENAWWIHQDAQTEQTARDTEAYLFKLGFSGGDGGGDSTTTHVYAYRILNSTIQ